MRIVFVGNYGEKKAGATFYSVARKLTNGLIRNGHTVYAFSDRDVARSSSLIGTQSWGTRSANRQLIDLCRNFRPDMIVLCFADLITNRTLMDIRAEHPMIRIAYVNLDPLFLRENPPRLRRFAQAVDASFITTAGEGLEEFTGARSIFTFIPNPVDRSIESLRGFERTDQSSDLICSIVSDRGTPERAATMRWLKQNAPDIKYDFYGLDGVPPIYGMAYFDAIGSARMGLNLNRRDDNYLYSSDRLAQYAGNGLLVFIARQSRYDEIFGEDEFAFYESRDELVDKLRYFKVNDEERQNVARRGYEKYHALFNERLVAQYIVEVTMGEPLGHDYGWPTEIFGADSNS